MRDPGATQCPRTNLFSERENRQAYPVETSAYLAGIGRFIVELSCKAHVYAAGYEADSLYRSPEGLAPRDSLMSCENETGADTFLNIHDTSRLANNPY
jgi:hypothetical protein